MVVTQTNSKASCVEGRAFLRLSDRTRFRNELRRFWDQAGITYGPLTLCIALAIILFGTTNVRAQFGLKCDSPTFAYSLAEAKLSDDILAAIRATCEFNKKSAEMRQVFGKGGWSWDLLPKAKADVAELNDLANKAATLNFKTADPRALGNIRNMYIHVGNQQRWLADQQKTFALRQQKQATSLPGASAPAEASQTSANPTFLFVIFRDDISSADKDAFLQAYNVSIVEGPNLDKSYRLRLEAPLPQDDLLLVLNSMNSQTRIVKMAFAK